MILLNDIDINQEQCNYQWIMNNYEWYTIYVLLEQNTSIGALNDVKKYFKLYALIHFLKELINCFWGIFIIRFE